MRGSEARCDSRLGRCDVRIRRPVDFRRQAGPAPRLRPGGNGRSSGATVALARSGSERGTRPQALVRRRHPGTRGCASPRAVFPRAPGARRCGAPRRRGRQRSSACAPRRNPGARTAPPRKVGARRRRHGPRTSGDCSARRAHPRDRDSDFSFRQTDPTLDEAATAGACANPAAHRSAGGGGASADGSADHDRAVRARRPAPNADVDAARRLAPAVFGSKPRHPRASHRRRRHAQHQRFALVTSRRFGPGTLAHGRG